jgi:hypothetical protein
MRGAFLLAIFSMVFVLHGQEGLSPLNFQQRHLIEADMRLQEERVVTAFAPYRMNLHAVDDAIDADTENWQRKEHASWVMRKLRNEHLFQVREGDFVLNGDAAFNLEAARQVDDQGRRRFTNSRGFQFQGAIGERFFFASSFYENQSIFPNYMDSVVSARGDFNAPTDPERGSVPGFGRWKPFNTSDSYDYDYTLGTGYVGYAIGESSFLQFGHDKQFLGYGYRSMLLSDGSSPYPFLRAHFSMFKGKLTYSTTWAVLQGLERVAPVNYNNKEALFRRMGARFSYLHFQPKHWWGLGVFDGTTWHWRDNNHPPSMEYYLPYGLVYFGDGVLNQVTGLNGFIRPAKILDLYGQYAWNRSSGGVAYQLGVKWQGAPRNLTVTMELNGNDQGAFYHNEQDPTAIFAEPFEGDPDFEHYYQHNDHGLAHPFLVEMTEFLVRLDYQWRDLFVRAGYHRFTQVPTLRSDATQWFNGELGFIINPRSNAQVVVGHINRSNTLPASPTTGAASTSVEQYTYLAFRTALFNRYLEF